MRKASIVVAASIMSSFSRARLRTSGGTRCGVAWNTLFLALCTAAGTTALGTMMAPMFGVAGAALFLGEPFGARQIAALVKAPDGIHAFLEQRLAAPQPNEYVDADKAWHILHFLLTGTAWAGEAPLNFAPRGQGHGRF